MPSNAVTKLRGVTGLLSVVVMVFTMYTLMAPVLVLNGDARGWQDYVAALICLVVWALVAVGLNAVS